MELSPDGSNTAHPECYYCGGKGSVSFDIVPFEMQLSNLNFCRLWNDLGLDPEPCGSVDPRLLLGRLGTPELSVRPPSEGVWQGGCHVITGGITYEQSHRYHVRLQGICEEASRREERIVWA